MSDQVDKTITEGAPTPAIFTPEPTPAKQTATEPAKDKGGPGMEDLPEWAQSDIRKAREQAKAQREQLRETEAKLRELQPLAEQFKQQQEAAKTEEQKLREKLATLEASQADAQAQIEQAKRESTLIRLAAKAGVDPDVAALLDINKLNLEDETAVLETLKKLSPVRVSGGGPSNPAGQAPGSTDADLRQQYFGSGLSQPTLIFGGNS